MLPCMNFRLCTFHLLHLQNFYRHFFITNFIDILISNTYLYYHYKKNLISKRVYYYTHFSGHDVLSLKSPYSVHTDRWDLECVKQRPSVQRPLQSWSNQVECLTTTHLNGRPIAEVQINFLKKQIILHISGRPNAELQINYLKKIILNLSSRLSH